MSVRALKAIAEAIEVLTDVPEQERTEQIRRALEGLQEVHEILSAHLSRGVQGEIFRDQLPLQEELPELGAFELEPIQTC